MFILYKQRRRASHHSYSLSITETEKRSKLTQTYETFRPREWRELGKVPALTDDSLKLFYNIQMRVAKLCDLLLNFFRWRVEDGERKLASVGIMMLFPHYVARLTHSQSFTILTWAMDKVKKTAGSGSWEDKSWWILKLFKVTCEHDYPESSSQIKNVLLIFNKSSTVFDAGSIYRLLFREWVQEVRENGCHVTPLHPITATWEIFQVCGISFGEIFRWMSFIRWDYNNV